jgi:hypothetical protein
VLGDRAKLGDRPVPAAAAPQPALQKAAANGA